MFYYLPAYFRMLAYTTDGYEIKKKSGVIFKRVQSVKIKKIQYFKEIYTPFCKYTGLTVLRLYLYGGRLDLPYLSKDDIKEIIKLYSKYIHQEEE